VVGKIDDKSLGVVVLMADVGRLNDHTLSPLGPPRVDEYVPAAELSNRRHRFQPDANPPSSREAATGWTRCNDTRGDRPLIDHRQLTWCFGPRSPYLPNRSHPYRGGLKPCDISLAQRRRPA